MDLVKSLLLGSVTTISISAAAHAADLPSSKAAPASYLKICDAYGAGFFYIPGTDTCVRIGGRVRADYAFVRPQDIYGASGATGSTINASTGVVTPAIATSKNAVHTWGAEARGRIDLDARTPTEWGTVQTVVSLRMSRTSGVLSEVGPTLSSASASPTLEAAYVRFAGFTFGAARDNFSFMPSTFYGAGHWASFANGVKQIAYTASFGGGFSATIALQDMNDTTGAYSEVASADYAYNNVPQVNVRLDFEQGWGGLSVMGAFGKAVAVNPTATYDTSKPVYAVGAGLNLNLPILSVGDTLHVSGAYADGMTEYTTNWTSFKGSDVKRNVGGFVTGARSWVDAPGGIETVKSWAVSGVFSHFWTPQIRHSFLASYGKMSGTDTSRILLRGVTGAFGDIASWNVGTQLAWLPVKGFEIGIEALYARVSSDVRLYDTVAANGASVVTKHTNGNWTGRMRVERTF